jgi:hypothetical protein
MLRPYAALEKWIGLLRPVLFILNFIRMLSGVAISHYPRAASQMRSAMKKCVWFGALRRSIGLLLAKAVHLG